jgi:hypothetical protein
VVVFLVALEMLGERGNARRQDRNLNFRRTGVVLFGRVLLDQAGFFFNGDRHRISPSRFKLTAQAGMSSSMALDAREGAAAL